MNFNDEYKEFLKTALKIKDKLNNLDNSIFADIDILKKYINEPLIKTLENEIKYSFKQDVEHIRFILKFILKMNLEYFNFYILKLYLNLALNEEKERMDVNSDKIAFIEYFLNLKLDTLQNKNEINQLYDIYIALKINDDKYIERITQKIN